MKAIKTKRVGFTLLELLVVITLIGLLGATIFPSVVGMFSSGADSQAYNMLSASLAVARARAIQTSNYVLVHVQMADKGASGGRLAGKTFMSVMELDKNNPTPMFILAPGFEMLQLPGSIAMGEVTSTYLTAGQSNSYDGSKLDGDPTDAGTGIGTAGNFTCFSIVFSPSGTVVAKVNDNPIAFDVSKDLFTSGKSAFLWKAPTPDENGVSGVVLFDYSKFGPGDGNQRAAMLPLNGWRVPINVYTGQLFPRK